MKKIPLFLILIILLTSCIKEYPIQSTGQMQPLPVFHMFLQPDSTPFAHFSHAADITKKIDDENTASIQVYKNGVLSGTMTASGNGNYIFPSKLFAPRDSFLIVANDGKYPFQIRGAIPSKIQILAVDTETSLVGGVGPAFHFRMKFTDSAVDNNFYRLYVKRAYYEYIFSVNHNITDSILRSEIISIYGSELPFIQNNFNNYTSQEILFSDATFNGTAKELIFYTTSPVYNHTTSRTTKLSVVIENIAEELYVYYNTRNAHLWQQQSISQLPGTIQGNIPGGYGVTGGFTFAKRVIGF